MFGRTSDELLMIYFTGVIAAVVLIWILLWWGARTPAKHKNLTPDRVKSLLSTLLYQGLDSGFLIISVSNSEQFVQIKKYIIRKGEVGLECGFPFAPWSEPYYHVVQSALDRYGFDYSIQKTLDGGPTTEFSVVHLGQDLGKSQFLITFILKEVFRVDPQKDCVAHFSGVSPDSHARIGF